jgi:uncharacterized protein YycO
MAAITHISQTKTGDVIHRHSPFIWYVPGRWISAAIRKITKSWSGHTAMIVYVLGKPFVAESDDGKIQLIPYELWAKDAEIVIGRIEISNRKRRKLSALAISQLGKKYDFKGTIIDQFILQIRGKWYGHTGVNAEDKMYCSEYVAWCYNKLLNMYQDWFKTPPSTMYADNRFKWIYIGKAANLIK